MIQPEEIIHLVKRLIPAAEVSAEDFTGTGDHFQVTVISPIFRGKSLVEQHQLIHKSLEEAFGDGRIHAVQIKTETPGSSPKKNSDGNEFRILG